MKNPYAKVSVLESVFNEIAEINSRLVSLLQKSLPQRHLTFCRKVLPKLRFFIILKAAHYRVTTLLGIWSTIDFFLKIWFVKTFSKKYLSKLQPEHCRFVTLLKETPSYTFSWEIFKLLSSIRLLTSSFLLKRQITWKITWKLEAKPRERDNSAAFFYWVLLTIKHLLENNHRNRTVHLVY